MRKFPAYKYNDILLMPAWLFWELLEESFRLDAQEAIELMNIYSMPYAGEDNAEAESFRLNLERQAKSREEVQMPRDEKKVESELKRIFGN